MGMSFRCAWRLAIGVSAATVCAVSMLGGVASAAGPSPSDSPSPSESEARPVITDDSHVLSPADIDRLRGEAADIEPLAPGDASGPDPVRIYTSRALSGDNTAFDRHYLDMRATEPANVVIVAVNTKSRHIIITSGSTSGLSDAGADQARTAFTDSFHADSNYANALSSALEMIDTAVIAGPSVSFPTTNPETQSSSGDGVFTFVMVGLVIIVMIAIAARVKGGGRRAYGGSTYYNSGIGSSSFDSGGSSGGGGDFGGGGGGGGDSGGGTSSGNF